MPKGVPLDLSTGTKTCPGCDTAKPLDQFFKTKATKHGVSVYCRECAVKRHDTWRRANLKRVAKHARKWRKENPRLAKDHILRSRYGIPLGTYDALLTKQNNRCAICGSESANGRGDFHVDHCHSSGRIRGLLCNGCNIGIGGLKHNPTFLRAAINYLAERG